MLFELSHSEIDMVQTLVHAVKEKYKSDKCENFLADSTSLGYRLPQRLIKFLVDYKTREKGIGTCIVRGMPVCQQRVGNTPLDACQDNSSTTAEEHFYLLLLSSVLGDAFAWGTQQNGKLVHDILPVKEHEYEQIGSGSRELITLHCEDAFHEFRADYLGLMCLRNPDKVATTLSHFKVSDLSFEHRKLLFEERFIIRPDNSHLQENNGNTSDHLEGADEVFLKIKRELQQGVKIAPLFGSFEEPYVRLDAYFMVEPEDSQCREAYYALCEALERNQDAAVLEPGDVLFVDNYRVLHGRKPFAARFDGQDRWLKRINVTRDLRRSRSRRASAHSRVIF